MVELDVARERLIDYLYELYGYKCSKCEYEFFAYDKLAKCCPRCGSRAYLVENWDVELLDWGMR